jgi:hypothetical protein
VSKPYRPSLACYRDSFAFFIIVFAKINYLLQDNNIISRFPKIMPVYFKYAFINCTFSKAINGFLTVYLAEGTLIYQFQLES